MSDSGYLQTDDGEHVKDETRSKGHSPIWIVNAQITSLNVTYLACKSCNLLRHLSRTYKNHSFYKTGHLHVPL